MLQIGIHYVDVLEMLIGPVRRVRAASAQLVLPGDNPDVSNLILEHGVRPPSPTSRRPMRRRPNIT